MKTYISATTAPILLKSFLFERYGQSTSPLQKWVPPVAAFGRPGPKTAKILPFSAIFQFTSTHSTLIYVMGMLLKYTYLLFNKIQSPPRPTSLIPRPTSLTSLKRHDGVQIKGVNVLFQTKVIFPENLQWLYDKV